jgi:hypothetical protein
MLMALLVSWFKLLHRKYKMPLMRLASLSEFPPYLASYPILGTNDRFLRGYAALATSHSNDNFVLKTHFYILQDPRDSTRSSVAFDVPYSLSPIPYFVFQPDN